MKIETLRQAIVRVLDEDGTRTLGTGFLATADGCILTCWHVVGGRENVRVQFEGETAMEAKLIAVQSDPDADIAVLRLSAFTARTPAELDDSWDHNDEVSIYGYQHQNLFSAPYPLYGKVSGETVRDGQTLITLTGIDVQPGCSGAPVYDRRTEMVIGIVRAAFDGKSTGLATPIGAGAHRRSSPDNVIVDREQAFFEQTTEIFRAMAYEIDLQRQFNTGFPAFYAELSMGATKLTALVGCRYGEPDRDRITQATALLQRIMQIHDLDRAFLITTRDEHALYRDPTTSARVEVLSLATLESRLFDFSGYLRSIEDDYLNYGRYADGSGNPVIEQFTLCDLKNYHVDVGCRELSTDENSADGDTEYPSAREEFYKFLTDDNQKQICFLGDYGTGKTTLCLQLTYELAARHLRDPLVWSRIPLFIPLNAFDLPSGVHQFVLDTVEAYGVRVASPAAFKYMMQRGKFVLILDAFDEVADLLDRRGKIRLFNTIRKLAGLHCKVVLTGRTHYFSSESEALAILRPESDTGSPSGDDAHSHVRVLELMRFDESRIQNLMSRHWPHDAAEKWRRIQEIHDLADLAKTPVLASLIITTLDELPATDSRHTINSAKLYDGYTKAWLDRDDGQTNLTPENRKDFMEELAWRMYRDNQLSVSYRELTEIILEIVPKTRQWDSEWLDSPDMNVRTCSFLTRNRHGDYQFAHKSFIEFFVAKRLVRRLDGWAGLNELWTRPVPYEISSFVGKLVAHSPKTVARVKELSVDRHNNGFLRGLCIDVQMILKDTVNEAMIFAMAISPDGGQLAMACGDGRVRIRTADLEPVTEFAEHHEWVRTLAYSEDGRFFASGGWDNRVVIRSMPDYALHLELTLPDRVNALCFTPDGTRIICGGYDHTLSVWDLRTGALVGSYSGHADNVQGIVIDPSHNAVISGSTDRTVRKWPLATPPETPAPSRRQGGPIRCLAISPDGRHMATGSWTGELILWDVDRLVRVWQSSSHQNMISDFGFAPDGTRFVSCSDDGSIKVWSLESNEPMKTLPGEDFVVTVCYSKDGSVLYSGGYDAVVRTWDTTTWNPIKSAALN